MTADAKSLHESAIVIDAVCPLLMDPRHVDLYRRGGATAVAPTVGGSENAETALRAIGRWIKLIRNAGDLALVRRAADIEAAKRDRRLGIILHFQGADPIEDDVDLIDAYKSLGVGMIQLTYNVRNRVGDGCEEPGDAGLSRFGRDVVKRLNEARIVVDCSHTGLRTTMDAIEASQRPTVFSHAGAFSVHPSPRNITDEQIRAVAATGGLVGAVGFPAFVAGGHRPTLDQFIAHIDHMVSLAGIDHVALGIDYFTGQHPIASDEAAAALYKRLVDGGRWSPKSYPPPPYHFPAGIETPEGLPNLTRRLLERGYAADDVLKIMGGNWVRVFREVWGA
ncbi:MAG: dipeptidase [Reyranella sp.]|uniref:dipeptidase n=2 Tax=Reyranella sp. TaxID=1929291 RepID=UPI003D1452C7